MDVGKEIQRQRIARGLSLRQLEKLTGVRYVTINEIELGKAKNGPYLGTIQNIAERAKFDIHAIAHAAFDLPPPAYLGELDETLREL